MVGLLGNMELVVRLSFIVCHETVGSASAFYRAVARETVQRRFLTSHFSMDNVTVSRATCSLRATGWEGLLYIPILATDSVAK